nr:tripartite motif-containing protein 14-like [Nothobranchius furzeri]
MTKQDLSKHYDPKIQETLSDNRLSRKLTIYEDNHILKHLRRSNAVCFFYPRVLYQVLCRESISGSRCYWEVDWKGTEIDVAVTYRGIRRRGSGNECSLGWNDKSWSLYCSDAKYTFVHNSKSTDIFGLTSSRIGVYLDYINGTLAFYSVPDGMRLLHKVQTTFREPVYPAFSVWGFGSNIKL